MRERFPDIKADVTPLDAAGRHFNIRIQDPEPGQVKAMLADPRFDQRDQRHECLTLLEVAFDITRTDGQNTLPELARVAADMHRFWQVAPAGAWHVYRGQGEGSAMLNADAPVTDGPECGPDRLTLRDLRRHLADGWQLADIRKAKHPPIRAHAYVKTTDQVNRLTRQPERLKASAWRARFEVTLQGAGLPWSTVGELCADGFGSLARLFRFAKLRSDLHPAVAHALSHELGFWSARQLGAPGQFRRRSSKVIGKYRQGFNEHRPSVAQDRALTEAARLGLAKLSKTWAR